MRRGLQRLVPMKVFTRRKHAICFLILFTLCTTGTYWITCSLQIYDSYQCPHVKDIFYNLLHINSSKDKYRKDIANEDAKKLESSEYDIDDLPSGGMLNAATPKAEIFVPTPKTGINVDKPKLEEKVPAPKGVENVAVPIVYNFNPAQGIAEEFNKHKEDLDLLSMKKMKYLDNFKNPCWFEELKTSNLNYKKNTLINFSKTINKTFSVEMPNRLKQRYANGDRRRLRCVPYVFVIGQPKCGTSDLHHRLMYHPDISTIQMKGPHWWSRARLGFGVRNKAYVPFAHYVDLFDRAAMDIQFTLQHDEESRKGTKMHNKITLDVSVSMLWDNRYWWLLPGNQGLREPRYTVADYVRHVIPQAKIIVILRNPTSRLFSDYLFFNEKTSVEQFHQKTVYGIQRYTRCFKQASVRSCAYNDTIRNAAGLRLNIGMYSVFIEDWLKLFPRDQLLVLKLEDYAADLEVGSQEVFDFLDLRPMSKQETKKLVAHEAFNKRKPTKQNQGEMSEETKSEIDKFYAPFNAHLAELLQDERFLWQS